MGKADENLLSLIIAFGMTICVSIAIACVVIVYLNIDVSFIIELLIVNIDIVAIFISGSIVIVTVAYSQTTKKNLNHQILVDLRKEYGSVEMMFAVQRLWTFYRIDCHEDLNELKIKYRFKSAEQNKNYMKAKTYKGKINRMKNSLSYQRRLVASFYYHLADLYILKMIPSKILFSIWSSADLVIIKKIIIPLEEVQEKMYIQDKGIKKINVIEKLDKLYQGCLEYEKLKVI